MMKTQGIGLCLMMKVNHYSIERVHQHYVSACLQDVQLKNDGTMQAAESMH